MGKPAKPVRHPDVSMFRRNSARITARRVLHPLERDARIAEESWHRRRKAREALEAGWAEEERAAQAEATGHLTVMRASVDDLGSALEELAALSVPELLGKVEAEQQLVRSAAKHLDAAREAAAKLDFGVAGAAVEESERELWLVGGQVVVALNKALGQATVSKDARAKLGENLALRRQAKRTLEQLRGASHGDLATHTGDDNMLTETLQAAAHVRHLEAAGYRLAADVLANQVRREPGDAAETATIGRDNELLVIGPQHCETFADIGGLELVKTRLRETVGVILERPDEAAKYRVVHNGILFHGPPGTGKNLISRALAGEYGLRYIRFSPATIASVYLHEAAANLRRLFELAKANAPCVLYLDEIDSIASDRDDQPSADHREVVTQLMICLEEYRTVPGLVITAGSNALDRLDPALREGRFDTKILVPLPDPADRAEVLRVHLSRRGEAVAWAGINLGELAKLTHGYNAAALEAVVSLAAQSALKASSLIDHTTLTTVIKQRSGQHRLTLEQRITWDDVVLDDDVRERMLDIVTAFSRPELAAQVGVEPPAGILLYGPPGTGKTTIAKAMASEISASFYEMSAADLLSKWAGESEQRVAKLFTKARANRPSIIFIDEVDALLRRRSAESTTKWEERILSQFLRELDGLTGGDGVLLVGATNRVDTIDEAIVGRRLEPVEIGLPGPDGRLKLLRLLCRDVNIAEDVNLRALVSATEGMSGADLKRLRDSAGMRALTRAARAGGEGQGEPEVVVTLADITTAIDTQRNHASLAEA